MWCRIAVYADWYQASRGTSELLRLGASKSVAAASDTGRVALALLSSDIHQEECDSGVARLGEIALVADARIDNLSEIRQVVNAGPDESAGVTLIRAYLLRGESFVDWLIGDFSLVLWDARRRRLLAARDPFGVRPLVYRPSARGVWFASEIEQILATFDSCPLFDDGMIVEYLTHRYRMRNETFFREIRQVPAGHFVMADHSGIEVRRYWWPPDKSTEPADRERKEYLEEFRRLFRKSVERRMPLSKPVIVHVSGGVDSSSIAVVVNDLQLSGESSASSICGASPSYPGFSCDEQVFVDSVARTVSFPIRQWNGTHPDPVDLTDPALGCPGGRVANIDGTLGDVGIAREEGAATILSGLGGDQLGSASGIILDKLADRNWIGWLRELVLSPTAEGSSHYARLRFVAAQRVPYRLRRFLALVRARVPAWLAQDLHGIARELMTPTSSDLRFPSHIGRHVWTNLNSDALTLTVNALQQQGRSEGAQYRFPFLDRELVRFVLTVPYWHWPPPGPYQRLQRDALQSSLPPEVAGRFGKAEFTPILINRIFRARPLIEEFFDGKTWASARYVDRDQARWFWRNMLVSPGKATTLDWRHIWAVVTLEAWIRAVLRYYGAPRRL